MDIPEQFRRESPDFAILDPDEVWGPFVFVHPTLGELLGSQLSISEEDKMLNWFMEGDIGKSLPFSEEPKIMEDGSIVVEHSVTKDVYIFRPLKESDFANFNLDEPVSMEELYELADREFAPFELEDDEEE